MMMSSSVTESLLSSKPPNSTMPIPCSLLQTVPGIGKILSLVRLDEIHDIGRFPSVQDFASYARLVKCAQGIGWQTFGYLGQEHRQRAPQVGLFRSCRVFLRHHPTGQKLLTRVEKKHGTGQSVDHPGPSHGAGRL